MMRVSVTVEVPLVTDREKGKDVGGQKKNRLEGTVAEVPHTARGQVVGNRRPGSTSV